MSISTETLMQAREEAETGNDQYSRGFVSAVITELLEARKEIEPAKEAGQPVGLSQTQFMQLMIEAGYNPDEVHPAAYEGFSWSTLHSILQGTPKRESIAQEIPFALIQARGALTFCNGMLNDSVNYPECEGNIEVAQDAIAKALSKIEDRGE